MSVKTGRRPAWLVGSLLVASCSFPDIEITGGGGAPTTSSPGSSTNNGSSGQSGSGQTSVTSTSDASSSTGVPCVDLDLDGARTGDALCCTPDVDCDCDDDDGDTFPGQTAFFWEPRVHPPSTPLAFDYNCDKQITREYEPGACGMLNNCNPTSPTIYFDFDTASEECGSTGNRRFCAGNTCTTDMAGMATDENKHLRCN